MITRDQLLIAAAGWAAAEDEYPATGKRWSLALLFLWTVWKYVKPTQEEIDNWSTKGTST